MPAQMSGHSVSPNIEPSAFEVSKTRFRGHLRVVSSTANLPSVVRSVAYSATATDLP